LKISPGWSRTKKRNEQGTILKRWAGRISIALIFPDKYAVGMANVGLQSVYAMLNADGGVVAERFFVPDSSGQRPSDPEWLSEESGRPLRDFDLIAFSVSFEQSYPAVVKAVSAAGLNLWARERGDAEPVVLAGGVATMINPEPLAPFIDAFVLGDLEAAIGAFAPVLGRLADRGVSRLGRLQFLAENVPGVYVPAAYRPRYDKSNELAGWDVEDGFPFPVSTVVLSAPMSTAPHTRIISPDSAFPDMFLVELARGCGRGCRFCAAGFVYRPPRPWPLTALHAALQERRGASRVGLVGLEFLGRDEIELLCRSLIEQGVHLGFSSLRADALTPSFVSLMKASEAKTATIAPEAGSQRLRRIINKNLEEEEILAAAERLVSGGIPNLKLYFMLGLPFETDEDVEDIVGLVDRIRRTVRPIGRQRGYLGTITVSVSTFVPKAWTPFQWSGFVSKKESEKRWRLLIKGLLPLPNVKLRLDSFRNALFQAVLSRGDRRLAPAIEAVALRGVPFQRVLKDLGFLAETYTGGIDTQRPLPWEIVQQRVRRQYLLAEWNRASRGKETHFCVPVSCKRCGACN
jgi:radical SAM superfamily enzyme YgiQ (UPF0313 family)